MIASGVEGAKSIGESGQGEAESEEEPREGRRDRREVRNDEEENKERSPERAGRGERKWFAGGQRTRNSNKTETYLACKTTTVAADDEKKTQKIQENERHEKRRKI